MPGLKLLRHFAGLNPIVVNAQQALIGFKFLDWCEFENFRQQEAKLFLARRRHQEVPKRAKALPLIGVSDHVPLAKDIIEQRGFAAVPCRDSLTQRTIQFTKALFYLAEVREQSARSCCDLQKSFFDPRRVQ